MGDRLSKRLAKEAAKTKRTVVAGFVLQGRPYMLFEDDDVKAWQSVDAATEDLKLLESGGHQALRAAESVVITDLDTGDVEVYR